MNTQTKLAEEFVAQQRFLNQESKVAFLKIQSWQFASRTPEIGMVYFQEAASMIKNAFFCFVPNAYILNEEGYNNVVFENGISISTIKN